MPQQTQVFVHSTNGQPYKLPELHQPVPGFTRSFTISQPSYFWAKGHIDTKHLGIAGTFAKAIMVAFQLKLNGSWLAGSKTGENILSKTHHYYAACIHGFAELQPGDYTIELHGRSASTAAKGVNGLAEIKATYNQVVYEIVPIN